MISKKAISNANLKLSELVLGMWHVHTITDDKFQQLINTAIQNGITSFDHADIYGDYQCEEKFGRWMEKNRSLRDRIQLVSKCGIKLLSENKPGHRVQHYDTSRGHIVDAVEGSLKN